MQNLFCIFAIGVQNLFCIFAIGVQNLFCIFAIGVQNLFCDGPKSSTKKGKVVITGQPFEAGQHVEVIMLSQQVTNIKRTRLTVHQLPQSGLIGLWKNRDDISNSAIYAHQLREQAQQRRDINYDFFGHELKKISEA